MRLPSYDNKPNSGYRVWRLIVYGMLAFAIITVISQKMAAIEKGNQQSAAPVEQDLPFINGEFMASRNIRTTSISGLNFSNVEVTYSLVDGLPIFEGDIILNLGQRDVTQNGTGIIGDKYRWPKGLVAYEVTPSLPNQERIHDAIAHWEAHTDVRFVERTEANKDQYPNYIRFQSGLGCASYVGMIGGMQPIYLASACTTGNTIHEIGHAVGLWHEQGRIDRDDFVTIHWENIYPGYAFNFDQHISDGLDLGRYDYDSIMHYPRWAFSKNGKDTIVPKDETAEIGQRDGLSEGDIGAIEELFEGVIIPASVSLFNEADRYSCPGDGHGYR